MGFLRGLASFIVLVGLWLVITVTGLVFIFNHTVNPATIKSILASDNGYQTMADSVQKIITDSSTNQGIDPNIASSVAQQVNGPLIQKKLEEAIDKYFAWFRGEKVDMKINLDELNQTATLLQSFNLPDSPGVITDGKLVKDLQLPTPSGLKQIKFFYHLTTIKFIYYLALIALLAGVLIALRASWSSRLIWLFHGVFWPALSFGGSLALIFVLKGALNENNSLFKDMPAEYKTFIFTKVRDLLETIFNNNLMFVIFLVIASVILLIVYIIVKHLPAEGQPDQSKKIENANTKAANEVKSPPPPKPTFY